MSGNFLNFSLKLTTKGLGPIWGGGWEHVRPCSKDKGGQNEIRTEQVIFEITHKPIWYHRLLTNSLGTTSQFGATGPLQWAVLSFYLDGWSWGSSQDWQKWALTPKCSLFPWPVTVPCLFAHSCRLSRLVTSWWLPSSPQQLCYNMTVNWQLHNVLVVSSN